MAGPYGLGDPSVFEGLPLPGSPVTASGEDPDELRMRMAGEGGGQSWKGSPWVLPMNGGGGGGADTGGAAPAPRPAPGMTPATPPSGGAPAGPGGEFEPAGFNADVARQSMSGQLEAGRRLTSIADQMQPDPQIAELEKKRQADAAAAPNPKDPRYKPGIGTRVLRGLYGAGLGLAEHGIFGAGLGALSPGMVGGKAYGAPTDAYDTALAANQKQVAGDVDQLSTAQNNFKQAQELRVAQQKATQEGGEVFGKAGTTATAQAGEEDKAARRPIEQQKANTEAQRVNQESPEGKLQLTQAQIDGRNKIADGLHMPQGYLRNRYVLTGEMQAAHEPTAEEIAVNRVAAAYTQEHGGQGPKTVADWQGIYAAARGGARSGGSGDGDGDKNLRVAAQIAERRVKDLRAQMQSKGAVLWSEEEKKQHQEELEEAAQQADELRQTLAGGAAPSATASNPAPGQQPPPAAGPAASAPPIAASAAPVSAHQPSDGQFSPDGKQVMQNGKWVKAAGADGMVRLKVPDGKGGFRFARFAPDRAPQAVALGGQFAGGE